MNKFIRGFAVVSLFGLLFQAGAYAQLPGDTCALAAGSSIIVNDSNSDFRDVILICDGANWRTMQFPLNRIQDGDNDTFVLVDTADDDVIRMTSVGQPVSTVFATGSDTTFSLSAASATPNIGISLVENGSNSALIGIRQATGFLEMDAIAAGSDIIFRSGGTERARLFNTGEFGIGVSASPQAQLDIAGDFRVQGFITPDNTYSSYWLLASDYNYIYVNNRPYLYMYGSSLEYLDIGETGDDANPSEIVIGDNHLYLDQANDRVGINMNDPKATLDVSDLIIVGTTSTACGSAQAGGLRWNSSERCMEVCSGGGWGCNTEVQCSDDIPDAFNFTNETNAALNTLIESDIIQVSGLAQCSITVSIEGAGSPEYRVCNDATCTSVEHDWSNVVNGFANNQYIQVRTTSPRLRQDTRTLNLRVGARATTWSVTVPGACPPDASPVAGSLCVDGTVYVGTTTDSGGSSYDLYSTPCRLPRRYIDGSCTGNVSTMPYNNDQSNNIYVGANQSNDGLLNTTTLVAEDPSTNPDAPYMAAQYCDNLGNISEPHSYGHTDWYLPARNELDGMCNLFNNVLNLDWSSTHWASTETNGDRAYYERGDCYSSHEGKTNKNVVRCVRRN